MTEAERERDTWRELAKNAEGKVLELQESLNEEQRHVAALRTMLEQAQCPTRGCIDGSIQNTGPDPQDDACPWCYGRHELLEATK